MSAVNLQETLETIQKIQGIDFRVEFKPGLEIPDDRLYGREDVYTFVHGRADEPENYRMIIAHARIGGYMLQSSLGETKLADVGSNWKELPHIPAILSATEVFPPRPINSPKQLSALIEMNGPEEVEDIPGIIGWMVGRIIVDN